MVDDIKFTIFVVLKQNDMKTREFKKLLQKNGCYQTGEGANHEHWFSPLSGKSFTVPRHQSKEMHNGTVQAILKQAGLK